MFLSAVCYTCTIVQWMKLSDNLCIKIPDKLLLFVYRVFGDNLIITIIADSHCLNPIVGCQIVHPGFVFKLKLIHDVNSHQHTI